MCFELTQFAGQLNMVEYLLDNHAASFTEDHIVDAASIAAILGYVTASAHIGSVLLITRPQKISADPETVPTEPRSHASPACRLLSAAQVYVRQIPCSDSDTDCPPAASHLAIELFLQMGVSPDFCEPVVGRTLVFVAAPALMRLLLAYGPDVNLVNGTSGTPLLWHTQSGSPKAVRRYGLPATSWSDPHERRFECCWTRAPTPTWAGRALAVPCTH
jgi:hypothetical protein